MGSGGTAIGQAACALALAGCLGAPSAPSEPAGDASSDGSSETECAWADDFDGAALDPIRWIIDDDPPDATFRIEGSRLVMSAIPSGEAEFAEIELSTVDALDIRGTTVTIDLGIDSTGASDSYLAWAGSTEWMGLGMDAGLMMAARGDNEDDGEFVELCSSCPSYQPERHRFWRIVADDSELQFEASADGEEWSPVADPEPMRFLAGYLVLWVAGEAPGEIITRIERVSVDRCGS